MYTADPPGRDNLLLVASTGGSVLGQALSVPSFRERIAALVADRECGAIEQAAAHGIRTHLFPAEDALRFSDHVNEIAKKYDSRAILSFYLRLFRGVLLERMRHRIVNFHPSLLPAFPGFHAFERSLQSGVRFVGNTAHFIDESVDKGPIIAQSMTPCPPDSDSERLRHTLFIQQCRLIVQIAAWLSEKRISVHAGKVTVADARFDDFEFSPALDDRAAVTMEVPTPPTLQSEAILP